MRIVRAALALGVLALIILAFSGEALASVFPSSWVPAATFLFIVVALTSAVNMNKRFVQSEVAAARDILAYVVSKLRDKPQPVAQPLPVPEPIVFCVRRVKRCIQYCRRFRPHEGHFCPN